MLDLDGTYRAVGDEHVVTPAEVGLDRHELGVRTLLLDPASLEFWAQSVLLRHLLVANPTVLAVHAGVVFLQDPSEITSLATGEGFCLIARCAETLPDDGLWPRRTDLLAAGSYSPHLLAVTRAAGSLLDDWEQFASDPATASGRWLDVVSSRRPHRSVWAADLLVSPWTGPSAQLDESPDGTLLVNGSPAVAVDLTGFDVGAPWLLDTEAGGPPRIRLSEHPALARLAATIVARADLGGDAATRTDSTPPTCLGLPVHDQLRIVFRSALDEIPSRSVDSLPDPFDPNRADEFAAWLVEPASSRSDLGLGRYLASIYRSRPDLRLMFPGIPGAHVDALLEWADKHGRHEDAYSATVIDLTLAALRRKVTPPTGRTAGAQRPGVNVVGHLRAELGVGESARLMIAALVAGDIPHATASVDKHVQSRQGATFSASSSTTPFDTTLLCVNADMTATVAATVPALLARSYRIGMWYWEVESFPVAQHDAFSYVDEVWVATDFIRRAIEPHSPVPVRTITPPLPKPTISTRTRTQIGLPERPYFLFSFDFLSTAERKNPWGLVDAFEAAFAPQEGPLLVIKSINADRRPRDAERLRLRVAGRPDILLLEDYLDAEDRDALVALCTCYVSLHRAEGLGLTMAEAMALGKPVIATGYSGNLEFMTEANSFLVPWSPAVIPSGCEPYPPGGTWAEPDTAVAAMLMRTVFSDPELAQARGRQAAEDIRTLHSPEVAARQIAARLGELRPARRARRRAGALDQVLATARRTLRR